ncbi:MAG: glycosyltransferase [Mycobacteriales bacterium]|nr:glycosyltransferase [Mycobacteriales bacterium]
MTPPATVVLVVTRPDQVAAAVEHLQTTWPADADAELVTVSAGAVGPAVAAAVGPDTAVAVVADDERPVDLQPVDAATRAARADALLLATTAAAWRALATAPPLPVAAPELSAVLIVRDEQERLPLCLASLRDVVDEVVVADTGSLDGTVAIAVAMGARVVHIPWTDDFAAARNAALEHARSDWVLHIDADEVVAAVDVPALRSALGTGDGLVSQVHHLGADGRTVQRRTTVFRRSRLRWVGRVHEHLEPVGPPADLRALPGLLLEHSGHLPEVLRAKGTAARNARLAQLQARDEPGWRSAFELARALHGQARRTDAVAAYLSCLAQLPDAERVVRTLCHRALAQVAVHADDAETAERHARLALALAPGDSPSRTALAAALHAGGDHDGALEVLDAPLPDRLPQGLPSQEGSASADAVRADCEIALLAASRPRDVVVQLAGDLETSAPRRALAVWRTVDGDDGARGRARCLAALGRLEAARRHLARVADVDELDRDLAQALGTTLSGKGDEPLPTR